MRRLSLCILCLSCLASHLIAQDFDRLLLTQQDITGTARYVAMAGAFTALGGDPSAINDNPAALGLYQRRELSFTVDGQYFLTYSAVGTSSSNMFRLPQLSWVFGFSYDNKQAGLLRHNFVLQYHRLRSYNRSYSTTAALNYSQTDLIASLTDGLSPSVFNGGDEVWNDGNVGWLSVMGYDCGVIFPDTTTAVRQWYSVLENNEAVQANTQVKEIGSANQYTVAYGANISNRFYFGVSLNMLSISHTKEVTYEEAFGKGGGYTYKSTVSTNGFGGNLALGLLYRPVAWFRMGASVYSPSYSFLHVANNVQYKNTTSYTNSLSIDKYLLPMRATMGVAFQFTTKGLLSLEYDLRCGLRNLLPYEHTLKIGAETVMRTNWYLRMGYAYRSSFKQTDFSFVPNATDTRTDTEFFNPRSAHYASTGFGYRSNRWFIDCAYQFRIEQINFFAHAYQQQPNAVDITSHRIVLTVGFTR